MDKVLLCFVLFIFLNGCCSLRGSDRSLTEKDLYKSLNKFAFKLHNAFSSNGNSGNLIYSPYSIATTLAMISAGAENKTMEEIAAAMEWENKEKIHELFGKLLRRITAKGNRFSSMNVASRIWVGYDNKLQSKFREIMQDNYNSKAGKADFKNDPEISRRKINDWVKRNTGNKITNLLGQGMIDSMTQMVLTNAVYFKALWQHPFNSRLTRKRKFYTTADKYFKVKMMEQSLMTKFARNSNFSVLELPYKGKKFSMVIVLPEEGRKIQDVEKIIDPDSLMNQKYSMTRVQVFLPKFELTTTREITQSLKALNIRSLFGPDCDLSGMFKKPDGIFVTNAIHKAFIELDERGTKAGAATSFITGRTFLPVFNANRPFLFFIKDKSSSVILFAGRYSHPE